jgi:hypothetical protein
MSGSGKRALLTETLTSACKKKLVKFVTSVVLHSVNRETK